MKTVKTILALVIVFGSIHFLDIYAYCDTAYHPQYIALPGSQVPWKSECTVEYELYPDSYPDSTSALNACQNSIIIYKASSPWDFNDYECSRVIYPAPWYDYLYTSYVWYQDGYFQPPETPWVWCHRTHLFSAIYGGDVIPANSEELGSPCPDEDNADPSGVDNQVSNQDSLNSSLDLKNGNVYHSQQVGFLNFSYNSLSSYNASLGLGWSHDFDIFIDPNSDGSLFLRTNDGNRIWFAPPSGDTFKADTKSRDSSTITKDTTQGIYTRTTRNGKKYIFNETSGKLTSIIDRNGNTTDLTYTGNDLTCITDRASGRTLATITVEGGRVRYITEPVTDSINRTYTLTYNSTGLLWHISDQIGNQWTYLYDANSGNKMSQKTDPSGNITTYHYNSDGKIDYSVDPNQVQKSIAYDPSTSTTTVTEKDGSIWIHKYYDGYNIPVEITDPFGNKTTYEYDYAKNHLLKTIYPDNTYTSFTYDADTGNVTSETDRRGKMTTFVYDIDPQKGGGGLRVTEIVDPGQRTSHITYDANGNVSTITDRTGATTTYLREDARKNITKIIDPLNHWVQYDYHDQTGNLGDHITKITDSYGRETNINRNKLGNILNRTDALNHTTSFGYDGNAELVNLITDPLGHSTILDHDPNGNINSITDPAGNPPTTFEYNYRGKLTRRTDALGNETIFTYASTPCSPCNGGGEKLTSVTDSAHSVTGYHYTNDSVLKRHITTITDPLQKVTNISYDPVTRQKTVTDRNGHPVTYTYTPTGKLDTISYPDLVTNTYDALDRLTQMVDPLWATYYAYDDDARSIVHSDPHGFTLSYAFDAAENLVQITYPDSSKVTYIYDDLNRLEKVRNWLSDTIYEEAIYHYDGAGRMDSFTHFNGIQTVYTYDAANRLTDMVSTVSEYHYTLDENGKRIHSQQIEPRTETPSGVARTVNYAYNAEKNRLVAAGALSYAYDDEGQLAGCGNTDIIFDYAHRLIGVGTDTVFSYDGRGNRVRAIRNAVETRYIYDRWGNLLAEANDSNQITRKYIYGKGLVAVATPSARYCYHFNGTGSTTALTNMNQTVVNSYAYDPFGQVLGEQEAVPQPFKFVGQYGVMAEDGGLYYMRARYYDSSTGRFISEDPIGFAGGDMNLFGYVQNDPLNAIDPDGKLIQLVAVAALVAVGYMAYNAYTFFDAFISENARRGDIEEKAANDPTNVEKYKDRAKACYTAGKAGAEWGLSMPGVHTSPPPGNAVEAIGAGAQTYIQNELSK